MTKKTGNYRGNIGTIMASDFALYHGREDHRKRIPNIVRSIGKTGITPTASELARRYSITAEEAKKLLTAVKRQLPKIRTDALVQEQVHTERQVVRSPQVSVHETSASDEGQAVPENPVMPHMTTILTDIRNRYGDEIRAHGEQTAISEGFVYLVEHELFVGWVKAGMTIDFETRLCTYNVSDPFSRFRFITLQWVKNRRKAELHLLKLLAEGSAEQAGEWFRIGTSEAKDIFNAAEYSDR